MCRGTGVYEGSRPRWDVRKGAWRGVLVWRLPVAQADQQPRSSRGGGAGEEGEEEEGWVDLMSDHSSMGRRRVCRR